MFEKKQASYSKGMKQVSVVGIDELDQRSVCRDQDELAVGAELEAGPLDVLVARVPRYLEVREGSLLERAQIVQLDGVRADTGGEDQAFGVEVGHRAAGQMHEAQADRVTQVPQANRVVERAREELVVHR